MAHTDFRNALQNDNTIEISVTGRTSGRPISLPIWFAVDGDTLYLIPVKGSDTEWYKNLRKTPTIQLSARGKTFTANARILSNQAQLDQVLEKFRDKYGRNVKSYYPKYDVAVEVPLELIRGFCRISQSSSSIVLPLDFLSSIQYDDIEREKHKS